MSSLPALVWLYLFLENLEAVPFAVCFAISFPKVMHEPNVLGPQAQVYQELAQLQPMYIHWCL